MLHERQEQTGQFLFPLSPVRSCPTEVLIKSFNDAELTVCRIMWQGNLLNCFSSCWTLCWFYWLENEGCSCSPHELQVQRSQRWAAFSSDQGNKHSHFHCQEPETRDVIVLFFSGTLLLSQWIVTKAILGKTGTNHIPVRLSSLLWGSERMYSKTFPVSHVVQYFGCGGRVLKIPLKNVDMWGAWPSGAPFH